jgi:hypothetical protein
MRNLEMRVVRMFMCSGSFEQVISYCSRCCVLSPALSGGTLRRLPDFCHRTSPDSFLKRATSLVTTLALRQGQERYDMLRHALGRDSEDNQLIIL